MCALQRCTGLLAPMLRFFKIVAATCGGSVDSQNWKKRWNPGRRYATDHPSIHFHIGYLWKDKSEDGVRKILEENVIPLDRLLVETDAPFMYPNTRASKLPQHVKDCLTEK